MHLMYTLDEAGNRIYTLKVSMFLLRVDDLLSPMQKVTEEGKTTKSAHPGTLDGALSY